MAGVENSFNKKEIKDNLNSLPNGVITAPFVNGNAEILRANTTILTTYTLQALDLSRIIRIPSSVTTDFDITIPQSFTGPSARRFIIVNESDAVVRLVIDGTLTLNYATDPFVLTKNTLFDIYRVSSLNYVVVNQGGATPQYSETEQVIGKWINDKPLYRKVVPFTNPTDSDYIDFDLAEVDFILINGAYVSGSLDKIQIPFFKDSTETGDRIVDIINAKWSDVVGSDGGVRLTTSFFNYTTELPIYRTGSGYLIFQYTKTTD